MATAKGRRIALLTGTALVLVLAAVAWVSWDEVLFRIRFESLGNNVQGYPEFRHRQTGIVFVKLPGGEFWMGTSEGQGEKLLEDAAKELGEIGRIAMRSWNLPPEQPLHKVTLSSFLIAKHEVSQAEWEKIMGSNPSKFQGENLPVERVSWEACQDFCRRTGVALPTEGQWEYACRAGTTTPFAFGKTLRKDQANFGADVTATVDSFTPNGFGLHNMHGNVSEWCEDIYDPDFYRGPEATRKNPVCNSGSESRIHRGGTWSSRTLSCRSAFRASSSPSYALSYVGFRPVYALR